MAYDPDIRVRVILRYIGVQVPCRRIITAFVSQRLYYARPVACESGRSTITDLKPGEGALLGAAATGEQVVIDLIVRRRTIAVENS
jgi:hypothetical protein